MTVSRQQVLAWLDALQCVYAENRERLTELDSAIGDADHGSNMDRGFTAVKAELAAGAPADIRGILQKVATVLIRTVGGASGPLYGTFFLRAGATAGETELDVLDFLRAGVEGVRQRGKAQPGDKTMLDVLLPALEAMRAGGLDGAVAAAETGMLATIPMQARKGRASYLGARSIGHQDPGATSAWLLIKTAAETWRA
jgi:phosphoenolpyruvate---glycerone phosphotransferase subunit DhaL